MYSNEPGLGLSLIGGAPDDRLSRTDILEHYLAQAREEVIDYIAEGQLDELETLYSGLDDDDAKSVWRALLRAGNQGTAIDALAYARAEELMTEAMS